jgi:hypothetical protein
MEMAAIMRSVTRITSSTQVKTGRLIHTATGELEATLELPEGVPLIEAARRYLETIGKSPGLAENFHFQGLQFALRR